ncbi:MAG: hypothetical protein AAGG75_08655 [Bacteroidota bacterium]
MMKTRLLLGLLSICFVWQLSAQSLIDDTEKLANILRQNTYLLLDVQAVGDVDVSYKPLGSSELDEPYNLTTITPNRPRTVTLKNAGDYELNLGSFFASSCPCTIQLTYGDTSIQIQVDSFAELRFRNSSNAVQLLTTQDLSFNSSYLIKKDFIALYGELGIHSKDLREGLQSGNINRYSAAEDLTAFNENPFLRRWLQQRNIKDVPINSATADTSLLAIETEVAATDAHYLALDGLLDNPDLRQTYFNIKDIELTYQSPIPNSKMALNSSAADIRIKSARMGSPFDATTIASGLSEFILERAQEEFNVAFMQRLKDRLNDPDFIALQTLFPKTKGFFEKDLDIINYKSLLPLAKQYFINDLENIGFNFSTLIEKTNGADFNNSPELFNLAMVYEVANLVYQDVPIDTILPMMHSRLLEREDNLSKTINLQLAESKDTVIKGQIGQLQRQMDTLSAELNSLNVKIVGKLFDVERSFLDLFSNLDTNLQRTAAQDTGIMMGFQRQMDGLYDRYNLTTSEKNERFFEWLGSERADNIPTNLEGRMYYDKILQDPKLELYNEYFGQRPDRKELVAAGLELSQNLLQKPIGDHQSMLDFLTNYYEELLSTEQQVQGLNAQVTASSTQGLRASLSAQDQKRLQFRTRLEQEIQRLEASKADEFDVNALRYLAGTLDTAQTTSLQLTLNSIVETRKNIRNAEEKLLYIESLVEARLDTLVRRDSLNSPLLQQLQTQLAAPVNTATTVDPEVAFVDRLRSRSAAVQGLMEGLESNYTSGLLKARKSANFLGQMMAFSTHLMYSFRTGPGDDRKWVDKDRFKSLMRDDLTRDIFLGLVYNRLSTVQQTNQLSSQGVATLSTKFMSLITETSILRDSLERLDHPRFVNYYPYVKLTVDLLNTVINTPLVGDLSWGDLNPDLKELTGISNQALALFENLYTKDYGYAITNVLDLYRIVAKDTTNTVSQGILKYGSFIANVANARTSNDIKNALLAAALPQGSSQLKRRYAFSLSVNSYLAIGGGAERLTTAAIQNDSDKWGGTFSFSVPVGIAASWKFKNQKNGSFSLFLPIIDLGAVTAFRIDTKNQVDELPELNFNNIIAPGGFLFYNIPRSPIMIGTGVQLGPQLRKVTVNGNEVDSRAWRWMAFIGVDVPLFNLTANKKE